MIYNVFSGTLDPAQSINQLYLANVKTWRHPQNRKYKWQWW